ncbi:hypothetical protein [Breznakiella homolactica]|uniref:Uncharacterized protein n=1 Tax=Breznakiella homolactica TaxID=2798577 RepID=A0A7T7XKQ4_9SPIR|nr:hypothetical protein [Breznakiella homolactica]QQO08205.1 hypothetical protein JFL75_14870 [Breznakiella homolactica]
METGQDTLLSAIKKIADFITMMVTTPPGITIILAAVLLVAVVWVSHTIRRASLLSKAAGQRFGFGDAFLASMEALGKMAAKLLVSLPMLVLVVLIALSLAGLGKTINRIEESAAAAQKIRDLTRVVQNLERSCTVADVHILSVQDNITRMAVDFYDPSRPGTAVERKELSLPGRDIYIDAMVLNFDYSEISGGRKINIAIPYRVFSDRVAQAEGVPLGGTDILGIPFIFNRTDDDIYGIAPDLYRHRLMEFMELVRDEQAARRAGIIRSVYGSAVHRRVASGDRFEIRVEQTGGLVLRDRQRF